MPAKRTLQDAELCFTQINDLKQMLSGVLNIGISYTFAPVLMEAVKDFTRQYPGVRLNIICRTMEELLPYRIVMPAHETQARHAFEYFFPGMTEKLNVVVEINEINVLLDLVRSTQMITFLSEATLYQKEGLIAIPIDATNTQMEGCVHTLKKVYRKRLEPQTL